MRGVLVLIISIVLAGCASQQPQRVAEPQPAIQLPPSLSQAGVFVLPKEEVLRYVKNLNPRTQNLAQWTDMDFAVSQSLCFTQTRPAERVALTLGERPITYGQLNLTLSKLRELLPRLHEQPELLASEFVWLRVGPDFRFTGYYEPTLEASPVRTERFRQPLYSRPPDYANVLKRNKGRYHSRAAIESKGVLRGRGLEIAWIEDPMDAFILQIQGSGRLRFPDGTIRYALYNGQNHHPYKALGKVMKERGLLPPDGISMQSIRAWLAVHPAETPKLLNANPRYVFFKLEDKGSYGSMGSILSPRVSVAVDQSVLPNGLATVMGLMTPDSTGHPTEPFLALTLPQDSGGAIRKNRVDLFFGNGEDAEHSAGYLDQPGAVMVLLHKDCV